MAALIFRGKGKELSGWKMPEASPERVRSLCPQLPGLMEKSMSAAECFVSSCLWSLPAGQALHC